MSVMTENEKYRVVIAGGGVAALEAMIALRELAEERVDLTLVAPDNVFVYRPLAVAEPFDRGTVVRFSLTTLTADSGARYEQGAVVLVSPDEQTVYTSRSRTLPYDALLIASGTKTDEAIPGALHFGGPADMRAIEMLIDDLERGLVRRVVYVVPTGVGWTLPVYELALLTRDRVEAAGLDAEVTLVTSEDEPLGVFGQEASETTRRLLEERGIVLRTSTNAVSFADGRLDVINGDPIPAHSVVTVPRLTGRIVEGIPHDRDGFVETDEFGRVRGLKNVYAAGDITTFPIKQGGLAGQEADVAAETIAAEAGAEIVPHPFKPVLRGLLLTGRRPAYLRAGLIGGEGERSDVDQEPLWWPPGKLAARHLAPYLADHARSPSGSRYEPSQLLL
jgi:sulfide:quinone oxidoreductase